MRIVMLDNSAQPLTEETRKGLQALGKDLAAAWGHPDAELNQ